MTILKEIARRIRAYFPVEDADVFGAVEVNGTEYYDSEILDLMNKNVAGWTFVEGEDDQITVKTSNGKRIYFNGRKALEQALRYLETQG